jgi:hypothetical protein
MTMDLSQKSGYFFVLSKPRPESLDEYHDWYNTEHGPLRVKLDFVLNGYRYRCVDPDPELFLAVYDLSDVDGLGRNEYTRIREEPSRREKVIFEEKMLHLDRRVYKAVSLLGNADGPAPVMMVVAFVVKETLLNDVHRWYEEVGLSFANER